MYKHISVEKDYHCEFSYSKYLEVLKKKLPDFHIRFDVEQLADLSVCFHIQYVCLSDIIESEFLNIVYTRN